LVYAIVSGAVASGVGYTIWYAALPGLSPGSRRVCSVERARLRVPADRDHCFQSTVIIISRAS
ncbi:MAG TPA: hypothetical protein VGJ16_02620, partial [Pirellulales bacterium]